MALLEVGRPFVPGREKWPEGCEYNYYKSGHDLRLFLKDPSPEEIKSINSGKAEFALYVEGDLIILLYQFEPGLPWSEAPYSWHIVAEPLRVLPDLEWVPETRAPIRILLIDAETGILLAVRIAKFSAEFTQAIHTAINQQAKRPWHGEAAYDRQINRIFQQFSTEDLLKRAIAITEDEA
jgi:hypothetical protein